MVQYEDLQILVLTRRESTIEFESHGKRGDMYVKRENRVFLYSNVPLNQMAKLMESFVFNPGIEVESFPELS